MDLRRVLHFVIEHLIVGLLSVADELVDILVNLNCCVDPAVFVLELNVVLAWLLDVRFHLNGVALGLEDLRCLVGHRTKLVFLAGLSRALLPNVHVDVEVLASLRAVIPTRALVKRLAGFFFGANLLLELINAFLVL